MTVSIVEGALRIHAPNASSIWKFDDPSAHQALGPMKAVDFVIQTSGPTIYLEIKDADQPGVSATRKRKFAEKLKKAKLDTSLKYKYRDTLLYEWCCGRGTQPIWFVVLIEMSTLGTPELMAREHQLRRLAPLPAPSVWQRHFVADVRVMNRKIWNGLFPDFRIDRIP